VTLAGPGQQIAIFRTRTHCAKRALPGHALAPGNAGASIN
jgi:hypothetical protein